MKKWIGGFLLAILLMGLFSGFALADSANLLANGGFENVNASGEPDEWYTSAYRTQEGFTRFEITTEKAHSGIYSAKITNANLNDARYVCTVSVQPETMYCVSGYILVDTMEDSGNGANLAIEDVPTYSDCVYDTQGEWKYVEWYGETEVDQNEVQLDVRVGGYGAESQGAAYFDDISVRQVDSLPDGVTASLWYNVDTGFVNDDTSDAEETTPEKSTLLFGLLAAAFLLLVAIGARYALRQETLSKPQPVRTYLVFFLAMIAALILRIVLGGNVAGTFEARE